MRRSDGPQPGASIPGVPAAARTPGPPLPAVCLLALLVALAPARAAADVAPATPEFHGFVSPGAVKSTANNYLVESHRGSVEFTEAAVNVTEPLGSTLRTGLQFFSSQIGKEGGFTPRFDWYYLDWHRWDWFSVRAGRVKLPFGLYNELSDLDPGRLTILLPQSVYPLTERAFLLAATGANLYGRRTLGGAGALSYSTAIDVPWLVDARLVWEAPVEGLRFAGSVLGGQLVEDTTLPPRGTPIHADVHTLFWLASAEYVQGSLQLAAEYGRWNVRVDTTPAAPLVPQGTTVSERYYVQGSWRFSEAFEAGLYYAGLFPDVAHRSGAGSFLHDVALSLRYDLSLHWLVKLEMHYLHGTAGLQPALNDGQTPAMLTQDWGLVLLRTTAYF